MEARLVDGIEATVRVPPGKEFEQWFDTEQPGLVLRKYKSGTMKACVRQVVNGRQSFKIIMDVTKGVKWVSKAREIARDMRHEGRKGIDPALEAKKQRAEAKARGQTFAKLREEYLQFRKHNSLPTASRNRGTRPRYYEELKRQLEKDWKPLGKLPIKEITKLKITETLDAIAKKQGPVAADRARAALSGFMTWAIMNNHLESTPMLKLKRHAGSTRRERSLSVQELRDIWHAASAVGGDYGLIVKMLMLTGMRRDEVGGLSWEEVKDSGHYLSKDQMTSVDIGVHLDVPGKRTKNHYPLIVPLNRQAQALLPPRPDPKDPMARTRVFGRREHTGFSGWSRAKRELDLEIAKIRRKRGERKPMEPWHLQQDLRRTFVTLANEMGLANPHVIEIAVNHISGEAKRGVAGVYNKAQYLPQRIELYDRWGKFVEDLVQVGGNEMGIRSSSPARVSGAVPAVSRSQPRRPASAPPSGAR